jgi:hypothetical protein
MREPPTARLTLRSRCALIFLILLCLPAAAIGAAVEYDLTIARRDVAVGGKIARGITVNGQIPGPVLRFTEGDLALIRVHNRLEVPTSIHWHGILVPPDMDGVPEITQVPIEPGASFTYEIPIRQAGTYWYHSHAHLQEQSGLYGPIVIEPREKRIPADREHVVLFSEWTTDDPHAIHHWLKRGSEWPALEKGSSQSVLGALKANRLGDYFQRELQRMPPMDIADVAYDHFLANGKPEIELPAEPGERVRLRIIDGSSSTYFHLEFAGGPLTIVSADGIDVEPVEKRRFLITVAETYDLLLTLPGPGSYELRATAHDGSGHASVWIGSGVRHPAPAVPRPNLYDAMHSPGLRALFSLTPAGAMGMPDAAVEEGRFDRPGMAGMEGMEHGKDTAPPDHAGHAAPASRTSPPPVQPRAAPAAADERGMKGHNHAGHSPAAAPGETPDRAGEGHGEAMLPAGEAPAKRAAGPVSARRYGTRFGFLEADIASRGNLAAEGGEQRPWTPYAQLRALAPTSFPPDRPRREIRLTLDGDMERYVWFMNNKPLSETDHILIREGEVVRFILINRTMMHHPMHLHGHFFRVINGQGDHAPLKHTVDVAPMSTTVIEFYGNEKGDWFFHCHLLYHMMSGMARLVHYENFVPAPEVQAIRPGLYHDPWYFFADADILSHMTEGAMRLSNTRATFKAAWEAGWQKVDHSEWEGVFTAGWHLNRFSSFFGGLDVQGSGSKEEKTRGILGLSYLLPLSLEASAWVDTDGGARFMLEKELHLTPRLALHGEIEYDTHKYWEGAVGLSYMLTKRLSLLGKWHAEYGFGGGLQLRF